MTVTRMLALKNIITDLGIFYKQTFTEYYYAIKKLNWRQFFTGIVSNLIICISFAFFCGLREENGDLYMNIFIPVFFANTLMIFYSCLNVSSDLFTLLTVFLTTTGTALQIFMLPATNDSSLQEAKSYAYILFFGTIASICIVPLVRFLCSRNIMSKHIVGLIFVTTITIYLFLLIFGKEINNTKAWISLGTISLQLTDVCKIIALISISLIIRDENLSEKNKSVISIIMLCIHSVFLFLLNELGTLCIILLVAFLARVVFVPEKKYVVREVIIFLLLGTIALLGCFGIYKIKSDAIDSEGNTSVQSA